MLTILMNPDRQVNNDFHYYMYSMKVKLHCEYLPQRFSFSFLLIFTTFFKVIAKL